MARGLQGVLVGLALTNALAPTVQIVKGWLRAHHGDGVLECVGETKLDVRDRHRLVGDLRNLQEGLDAVKVRIHCLPMRHDERVLLEGEERRLMTVLRRELDLERVDKAFVRSPLIGAIIRLLLYGCIPPPSSTSSCHVRQRKTDLLLVIGELVGAGVEVERAGVQEALALGAFTVEGVRGLGLRGRWRRMRGLGSGSVRYAD